MPSIAATAAYPSRQGGESLAENGCIYSREPVSGEWACQRALNRGRDVPFVIQFFDAIVEYTAIKR